MLPACRHSRTPSRCRQWLRLERFFPATSIYDDRPAGRACVKPPATPERGARGPPGRAEPGPGPGASARAASRLISCGGRGGRPATQGRRAWARGRLPATHVPTDSELLAPPAHVTRGVPGPEPQVGPGAEGRGFPAGCRAGPGGPMGSFAVCGSWPPAGGPLWRRWGAAVRGDPVSRAALGGGQEWWPWVPPCDLPAGVCGVPCRHRGQGGVGGQASASSCSSFIEGPHWGQLWGRERWGPGCKDLVPPRPWLRGPHVGRREDCGTHLSKC